MPLAVAFFLSGAAALILQVLWTRMMGHVLGASALAVSTVLTVFMGGLALGSHLGGQRARAIRRPVLAFAVLEAGVGLYGLAVPTLLESLPTLQVGLAYVWGEARDGQALLRFFLAALVLLPPTTAMGATLPLLAEAAVGRMRRMAETTGRLYAANTLGAVAGALLSGFWLIPTLGISTTVRVAAGIDIAVALGVLLAFRVGGEPWLVAREAPSEAIHLYEAAEDLRVK
ncbi:MAG: fused MFS/spermidine synthase, partial [Myxococcota bacterium]